MRVTCTVCQIQSSQIIPCCHCAQKVCIDCYLYFLTYQKKWTRRCTHCANEVDQGP